MNEMMIVHKKNKNKNTNKKNTSSSGIMRERKGERTQREGLLREAKEEEGMGIFKRGGKQKGVGHARNPRPTILERILSTRKPMTRVLRTPPEFIQRCGLIHRLGCSSFLK